MSMTEITEAPARKRKGARKRRATAAPKPKPVAAFVGLTALNCCAACSITGCVISGKPYCGHPFKGGLQGAEAHDKAAVDRLKSAKTMLGKAKIKVEI